MTSQKTKKISFIKYASAAEIKEGAILALNELIKREEGAEEVENKTIKKDFSKVLELLNGLIKNSEKIIDIYKTQREK